MVILSRASNELARRSTWTCLSCSSLGATSAALITAQRRPSPPRHQRRPSSSKASSSPKEYPRSLATPADSASKSATQRAPAKAQDVSEPSEKRSSGRPSKRRPKESDQNQSDKADHSAEMNLPYVPSTQNLHPLNVHLASFFSTHRPLSITNAIPPPTSASAFSSLFHATPKSKASHNEVIYTLASAAQDLENLSSHQSRMTPEEIDLRTAITQASSSNVQSIHERDLPAKSFVINLQELAKNFQPYTPPPPPVPLGALKEAVSDISEAERRSRHPQRKSYKTTLTIYENTHADGQKSYETYSSPVIVEPTPPENEKEFLPWTHPRGQPFLGRMRERQIKYGDRIEERMGNNVWHLISVKRQRRLKMKKHKYKKLMKKTKNLRRRLDRT